MGSVVLGLLVSPLCWFFVAVVKEKFHYDDALDVFGVHCIGGIFGALMTGVLVAPSLGGTGLTDYTNLKDMTGTYDMGQQVLIQLKAVISTLVWSGAGSAILYWIVDLVIGLRVSPEKEREGLDISEHSERAYNY
jgi:Amt family ammonium transporter